MGSILNLLGLIMVNTQFMRTRFNEYLSMLNMIGVEYSAPIFSTCFTFLLSHSRAELTFEQLDNWVRNANNPIISNEWIQQKEMKYPEFILLFGMWHFRNKTLQENLYHRQDNVEKAINIPVKDKKWHFFGYLHAWQMLLFMLGQYKPNHTDVDDIVNVINQDISQLSPFDGVALISELMGAWMLTCPRELILSGKNETKDWKNETMDWKPDQGWIKSVFPDSLAKDVSADELELLYISDYYLYYAFWDLASYNVYK
jgi:hypothetical protein